MSRENVSLNISIDDFKGMPTTQLFNKIISENKIISGDDLVKLLQIEFVEPALVQPDWVEEIYGYRAWLMIGEEGYYSAIVYDAGNGWYGIQAVFPTIGTDYDFYNYEQDYPRRPDRQNAEE